MYFLFAVHTSIQRSILFDADPDPGSVLKNVSGSLFIF